MNRVIEVYGGGFMWCEGGMEIFSFLFGDLFLGFGIWKGCFFREVEEGLRFCCFFLGGAGRVRFLGYFIFGNLRGWRRVGVGVIILKLCCFLVDSYKR